MGKQAQIRKIRKRIKAEGGISKQLVKEISIHGYSLVLRSDKSTIKVAQNV